MKKRIIFSLFLALSFGLITSCEDEMDMNNQEIDNRTFEQEDIMGRPAINTVFVTDGDKDDFNTMVPSSQGMAYDDKFENRLLALNPNYTTNALGFDAEAFTGVLATDVLSVALDGPTTFFDGTNVLTGRNLADDVISVELLLIFGGPDGTANPQLTDDNVDANDKAFLGTFPYLATPH